MPRTEGAARAPRTTNQAEVVVIWWRDIPCQVNGQVGRERHQVLLPPKFQRAVDRAKRKAGIVTAHEDVAQWRRTSRPCDGAPDVAVEAAAEAKRLSKAYSVDRLGRLAFVGGFEADVEAHEAHHAHSTAPNSAPISSDSEENRVREPKAELRRVGEAQRSQRARQASASEHEG